MGGFIRIAGGKITLRELGVGACFSSLNTLPGLSSPCKPGSAVGRSKPWKERSAALPSGEGEAALLGVLASCLEGCLRNFRRWAPFRAGPIESVGLGANPFDGHSCNHKLCDSAFLDALSGCRTAAKLFRGKSRIFLALQTRAKTMAASTRDSVPSGEQSDNLARRDCRLSKNGTHFMESASQAAAPPLFSRARISWPSRFR